MDFCCLWSVVWHFTFISPGKYINLWPWYVIIIAWWLWHYTPRLPGASLTHWGRDKMAAISQKTFSNAISWMKMCEFRLRFHWSLSLRVQLTIFQHWFRWWLAAVKATSHYLNQWLLVYPDIGKSTGPRSSTGENSGGPMKTLSVPVLLSSKKSCCMESLYGDYNVKKKIGSIKSFGRPIKLGFSMWLPVLRSGKGPKVFPMSVTDTYMCHAVSMS